MEAFKTYFYGRSTADRKAASLSNVPQHGTPTLTKHHRRSPTQRLSYLASDTNSIKRTDSGVGGLPPSTSDADSIKKSDSLLISTQYTPAEKEHNWRTVALWLYVQQQRKARVSGRGDEGVMIQTSATTEKGLGYVTHPANLGSTAPEFVDVVRRCGFRAATTMRNATLSKIFTDMSHTHYVPLADGIMVQIVPNMSALAASLEPHAFAAWVTDADCLVVWDEQAKDLIACCDALEQALLQRVWDS